MDIISLYKYNAVMIAYIRTGSQLNQPFISKNVYYRKRRISRIFILN